MIKKIAVVRARPPAHAMIDFQRNETQNHTLDTVTRGTIRVQSQPHGRHMPIRYFANSFDTTGQLHDFSIDEFVREFTRGPYVSTGPVDTPEQRKNIKERSPAFSPGNSRHAKGITGICCLPLDLDGDGGLEQYEVEALQEWLDYTQYRYVMHHTFSSGFVAPKQKLRIILFFEKEVTSKEYLATWKKIVNDMPVKPDASTSSPARIYYRPHVHEIHREQYRATTGGTKLLPALGTWMDRLNVEPNAPIDRLRVTKLKHHALNRAGFMLGQRGGNVDEDWAQARAALEENKVSDAVVDWSKAEKTFRKAHAEGNEKKGTGWRGKMDEIKDKEGNIKGWKTNDNNAAVILRYHEELQGVFRHNLRAGIEAHNPPWAEGVTRLEDHMWFPVNEWIREHTGLSFDEDRLLRQIKGACNNASYDPFRDYLDSLVWDGKPRLNTWLRDICHTEGREEYHEQVGSKWLISLIARTYTPDEKVDTVLVLVGKQGLGKSQVGEVLGGEYARRLQHDIVNKDTLIQNAKATIVEISELASIKGKAHEAVKDFISGTKDEVRPAYGRFSVPVPRRSILLGTTNKEYFLTDEENRRFWPVVCHGDIDIERLRAERDQLLAEAKERYNRGEKWWFKSDELREVQEQHQEENPYENGLIDLEGGIDQMDFGNHNAKPWQLNDNGKVVKFTITQLYERLKANQSWEKAQLRAALARRGWVSRKSGDHRYWCPLSH